MHAKLHANMKASTQPIMVRIPDDVASASSVSDGDEEVAMISTPVKQTTIAKISRRRMASLRKRYAMIDDQKGFV